MDSKQSDIPPSPSLRDLPAMVHQMIQNQLPPFQPGIFNTRDWRIMSNTNASFIEIPGFHVWTQFFVNAQPPTIPLNPLDHFSFCIAYAKYAQNPTAENIIGYIVPDMGWKNLPMPTQLHVQSTFPFNALRGHPWVAAWLEPFDISNMKPATTLLEEMSDCMTFYSMVFMQLGVPSSLPVSEMMRASAKLRFLCRVPLCKFFNVGCKSNEDPALRNKAEEEKCIKEVILWNKLMMDHVIHYDVKMKMKF
ncbi:unnamed protein product [Caenorhabditis nigoni]